MPEVNNVQKFVTPAQFASYVKPLRNDVDALVQTIHVSHNVITSNVTSWKDVQIIVRAGLADKAFPIGTKMYCRKDNVTLEWDVIGIDHDTPADPQFTHSLTLQLHDCFPTTMQFDAPEAFYYCHSALEAGTHHFTANGTDYQFTLESNIAANSQLILNFTDNTPTSIFVSAEVGGDFVKDTNGENNLTIAVTAGSGGEPLNTNYINHINRVIYGSNNYKESAIRQWLGSNAAAGSVWTPQTNFDRPPEWHTGNKAIAGFLNGMDADFLAVIGKTAKVTARNTVTDGGGVNGLTKSDRTDDYFFLPSISEVYGGVEVSGVDEGAPYPYYADYSSLSEAGVNNDSNRIKNRNGTAQWWWNRTPNSASCGSVRTVYATGYVNIGGVYNSYGVAPACNII